MDSILKNIVISIYDNVKDIYNKNNISIYDYIVAMKYPHKVPKFKDQKIIVEAIRKRKSLVVKFIETKTDELNPLSPSSPLLSYSSSEQHALNRLNKEIKTLKSKLISITPGGLFNKREESALLKPSNLLQLDIDWQDNMISMQSLNDIKRILAKKPYIAYTGLSTSAIGLWSLVLIENSNDYKEHFEALKKELLEDDIIIDPVVSNVVSVRYYSYDPKCIYNLNPIVYTKKIHAPIKKVATLVKGEDVHKARYSSDGLSETSKIVAQLINTIYNNKIDITNTYAIWRNIAIAFANTYGKKGYTLFNYVSMFHPNYDSSETKILYDGVLKYIKNDHREIKIDITYFLYVCNKYDVRYK